MNNQPNPVTNKHKHKFAILYDYVIDDYLPIIGTSAFAVYCVLLRRADRDGQSYPSIQTIAKQAGMSRDTAVKSIAILIEQGLLRKDERKNEAGEYLSNLYTILDARTKI